LLILHEVDAAFGNSEIEKHNTAIVSFNHWRACHRIAVKFCFSDSRVQQRPI